MEGDLDKYVKVNNCETVEELKEAILSFQDEEGYIQGRNRRFHAQSMCIGLELYMEGEKSPNVLTRMWGIRQQAMYLKYYMYGV